MDISGRIFAAAHTAEHSMQNLNRMFGECVLSHVLWPQNSPDVTLCEVSLWGHLKNEVCVTSPHIGEELSET
jgi:hypothetical protein